MSDSSVHKKPPTGYKSTDLGLLPNCWDVVLLGDLFVFKNGLNKAKRFFGTGTPIVNYMDVFERPGLTKDDLPGRVNLSPEEVKNFEVRLGDVFFTRTSETVEEVGVASVMLDEPCDTVFSGFVLRARPRDGRLNDRFKQYCFATRAIRSQIVSNATYTTRALTNGRSLSAVRIAVPPKPEQRAIAETLSDVDGLLRALEKLIAKKRAIKQAAMQQLLTGKTRLPGFAREWEKKRFGDLCACLPTANNPRSDLNEHGEVEYIHYGDVHAHTRPVLDCTSCDLPRIAKNHVSSTVHLQDGDLVMVDASEDLEGVGKSVEIQGAAGKTIVSGLHTILCRGNRDDWAMGFKAYLQFNPTFRSALMRVAAGTSVYAISKKQLADAELCLPSLREQEAIVSVLSDMDAEITALERRRDKTRAIKQGMMQTLLTGRVRLVKPESASEEEAIIVTSEPRGERLKT